VAAVVLNVTVVQARAGGYATVFPCGEAVPNASNLNFAAGQTVPNAVVAKVGAGGKVCVFAEVPIDLLVDVNGYVPAGSSVGSLSPARLLDSRPGLATVDGQFQSVGRRPAGSITEVKVAGRGGISANAAAVMLNVTAVSPDAAGYLTVYPCGADRPLAWLPFGVAVTFRSGCRGRLVTTRTQRRNRTSIACRRSDPHCPGGPPCCTS
jgi:hypothetical protein